MPYSTTCQLQMKAIATPTGSFSEVEFAFDIPAGAKEDWTKGCSSSADTWGFFVPLELGEESSDYPIPPELSAWSTEYPNYNTTFVLATVEGEADEVGSGLDQSKSAQLLKTGMNSPGFFLGVLLPILLFLN